MKPEFDIKIIRNHWVKDDGKDDPQDLCSHGKIYLKIGNEILSDEDSSSWTTSSAALLLMRTIISDYIPGNYSSQLIPCCGHFFMASENEQSVDIMGCPNGIDWTIQHENQYVKHITQSGTIAIIGIEDYKKLILELANTVENFYIECRQKEIPSDQFDKKGYQSYWREFKFLRSKLLSDDIIYSKIKQKVETHNIPKSEEQLINWMKAQCYNFSNYSIAGNIIYEGHGIDKSDELYTWYYTERGNKEILKYFDTEEEIIKFAYNEIKSDKWAKSHIVGFTSDESKVEKLKSELEKLKVEYFQDKILYSKNEYKYRIFVFGCDSNKVEILKKKYYKEKEN